MDIESLKSQAITIRDERERSANTATRVGRALLDTVNAVEENNTAIVAANANIATNAANITTNAANIATANANIATNKANIEQLQAFYHGDLGNHASWTDAQARLDLMATDGSQSGQYLLSVGAVPFIVIHTNVNDTSKIFTQAIIGSAFINSETATLQTAANVAVNIFSRTYASGNWGAWVRLAALSEVPTVQQGADGTQSNYIYQKKSDPTLCVLSGVGKLFQESSSLKLRFKIWGSGNRNYNDGLYSTYICPTVTAGADGAMNHNVYSRILNTTFYEGASTDTAVKIYYTNFTTPGNKILTIGAATTAKAGVMTVAHVNALNSLSSHIVDLGDFVSEEEALRAIGQLGVCNDRNIVHAHLTYHTDNSSAKTTLILIQSIEGKQCRQYIFNKCKVFSRLIHFKDESLTEHEYTEDFTFMFPDRLKWSDSHHGYLMSQFGSKEFGEDYSDSIPFASATADGLMSKDDYALLQKIKAQLNL